MTLTIPPYLRLHPGSTRDLEPAIGPMLDAVSQFWQAYTEATGWRIDAPQVGPTRSESAARSEKGVPGKLSVIPSFNGDILADVESYQQSPAVTRDHAERLAAAAAELTRRLESSQAAYRQQEAEMAVTATPTGTPGQSSRLVERLERILRKAMIATRCDAAGVYMLDDDTTSLKLRACLGLPADRLQAAPRALRGSRADVESLVQEVVLIDDLEGTLATTWNSPEPFASAIVTRLEEDDLPIGTLWLWSSESRSFTPEDGEAAQLAALAIATELARAALQRERSKWNLSSTALKSTSEWQLRQLPPAVQIAPGYAVDGWTESPRPWATSWHAWDVLPDGDISFALAEASLREMDGAMIAATARAAFAAHSNYRHTVTDMMQRISDSLWQTNTGDQLVSLAYIKLNPETGEGEIASAGSLASIIVSSRGYRPLTAGRETEPLASSIDCRPHHTRFHLQKGEAVVCVNANLLDSEFGLSQSELAIAARDAMARRGCPVLASIRRALAHKPLDEERAGVVLIRQ